MPLAKRTSGVPSNAMIDTGFGQTEESVTGHGTNALSREFAAARAVRLGWRSNHLKS